MQGGKQLGGVEDVNARVDFSYRFFRLRGVLLLDDFQHLFAVAVSDDPPVTRRILHSGGQHRRDCLPRAVEPDQFSERAGREERRVSRKNDDLSLEILQKRFGLHDGVAGAELRLLQGVIDRKSGGCAPNQLCLVTDDEHDLRRIERL